MKTARSYKKFLARLEAVGLQTKIARRALALHVTLLDLYEGPNRTPSIALARRSIYLWLMKEGRGLNEIARLFDRAPSGVMKLTRKRA